ncbi:LysM peptidoglycan-binding domain-containing protein [Salibacteraceae bacterium]|nr:LysM peptidoglycan-binding domain-containing protein [Salibacteraceae bacterium]
MSEENSKEVLELKKALRQKRNAAQAGLFVAVIVAVFSAAWIYIQGEAQSQISHEAGEIVVTADSLSQINSKLQEQEMHIQTQDEEIARMREEMSKEQNDPSSMEADELDGSNDMGDSQDDNSMESAAIPTSDESIHIIEKGETLWSIAVKYFNDGHRNAELAANNGIADAGHIIVGETLRLH